MPDAAETPLSQRDLLLELLLDRLGALEGAATPIEQASLTAQLEALERQIATLPKAAPGGPALPA